MKNAAENFILLEVTYKNDEVEMKKYLGSFREYMHLIVGNLGFALAFDLFFSGNELSSGGFSGLGLVINHFAPFLSVGLVVFVVSVPIFIWSYFVEGAKYTISALISTAVLSLFIDALAFLPTLTYNRLLAAICGGAMFGFSASILIKGRVSGSGTDLLARLLITKFRRMSLGAFLFICDCFVVVLSVIAFGDIETGIYSAFSIVVSSFVMDEAIRGLNRAVMFQVITNADPKVLAEEIDKRLERGSTLIHTYGMYQGEQHNMLLVAVGSRQVYEMKDIIKSLAPDAFVMMVSANEIMGEGFEGVDVTEPLKDKDK